MIRTETRKLLNSRYIKNILKYHISPPEFLKYHLITLVVAIWLSLGCKWWMQVKVSDLEGKVVGLLFAANWYPPCRGFTQILVGIYEELKSRVPQLEIVYVSSDENLDAFNSFYGNMPWLAIPFSDLETKKSLTRKYDVEAVPCLILLQPDDRKEHVTVRDGVELIYRYGIQAYPFSNERLEQLQKEDKVKRDNQTLTNLLANHHRDYVLSHTHTGLKKVNGSNAFNYLACMHATVFHVLLFNYLILH